MSIQQKNIAATVCSGGNGGAVVLFFHSHSDNKSSQKHQINFISAGAAVAGIYFVFSQWYHSMVQQKVL